MEKDNIVFSKLLVNGKKAAFFRSSEKSFLVAANDRFISYIRKLCSTQQFSSNQEIEDIIIEDFQTNLTATIFEAEHSFENYMDLKSCKYLQNKSELFNSILQKVTSENYTPSENPETFDDFLELYVYGLNEIKSEIMNEARIYFDSKINNIADNKELSINEVINKVEQYTNKYVKNLHTRNKIKQGIQVVCHGLFKYLPTDEKYYEKELRNNLESSILKIISNLKSFGAYQIYERTNLCNLSLFQFSEFQANNGISANIDLEKSPGVLNSLSIDDLLILNTFWLNRYIKELENYMLFLGNARENGKFPEIINPNCKNVNLSSKDCLLAIEKRYTIRPIIEDFLSEKIKEASQIISDSDKKYVTFSYDPLTEIIDINNFKRDYKNYFKHTFPNVENDADKDIIFYAKLLNATYSAYQQKNTNLHALITNISSNPNIVNAGIIAEKYKNENTIELPEHFIGIGIDANLTAPVKEHSTIKSLKRFIKSYTGSTILPLYEGIEDFFEPNTSNLVSTQLVLPFSEKQKEILKKFYRNKNYTQENKKFIQHLIFLSNSQKLPDSLAHIEQLPNGKAKRYFIRKYVDLETGYLYTRNDKGEYVRLKSKNINRNKSSLDDDNSR